MGWLRRALTSWSRHHRSRGFGIHSPFAFRFVREVLRERLPYYAYRRINALRAQAATLCRGKVIPAGEARMLFRIVNHFNPVHMLQVGVNSGVECASMLAVSSRSTLCLCHPGLDAFPAAGSIVEACGDRVQHCPDLSSALVEYRASLLEGEMPFVLIDGVSTDAQPLVRDYLHEILAARAVVVMRNLNSNRLMNSLWLDCKHHMPMGQTYTNEKVAVLYATPKLQREDFFLWL